jgi:hypothetical protein
VRGFWLPGGLLCVACRGLSRQGICLWEHHFEERHQEDASCKRPFGKGAAARYPTSDETVSMLTTEETRMISLGFNGLRLGGR